MKANIKEIKDNVGILELLQFLNYKEIKSNIEEVTIHTLEINQMKLDTIIIAKVEEELTYYSLALGDRGDVVDLVRNRIEQNLLNNFFSPKQSPLITSVKVLLDFLAKTEGEVNKKEPTYNYYNLKESSFTILISSIFSLFHNCQPINDFTYLANIGINRDTALLDKFNKKIYNVKGLYYNKTYHDTNNIAFPITNSINAQKGLYYRNAIKNKDGATVHIPFFAEHSNEFLLWTSIKESRVGPLTLVSSPLQALAHEQYYRDAGLNTTYAAVFEVNKETINEIHRISDYKYSHLQFSLNVSTIEALKELQIICSFANNLIQISQLNDSEVILEITASSDKEMSTFLDLVKSSNIEHSQKHQRLLGSSAREYLMKGNFKVSQMDDKLYVFCPRNYNHIYRLENALIKSFSFKRKIKIEKAKHIDWINQNSKEKKGYPKNNFTQKEDQVQVFAFNDKTF